MPKTVPIDIRVIDMPEVQAVLEQLSDEITRLQRALTDKTVALAAAQIELIGSENVTLRNGWRDEVERLRRVETAAREALATLATLGNPEPGVAAGLRAALTISAETDSE